MKAKEKTIKRISVTKVIQNVDLTNPAVVENIFMDMNNELNELTKDYEKIDLPNCIINNDRDELTLTQVVKEIK